VAEQRCAPRDRGESCDAAQLERIATRMACSGELFVRIVIFMMFDQNNFSLNFGPLRKHGQVGPDKRSAKVESLVVALEFGLASMTFESRHRAPQA